MTATAAHPEITLQPVKTEAELYQALAIREVVFIEEQHVPEGIERDEADPKAHHILAMSAGHAVGTGRLVMLSSAPDNESGRWAQVSRMAVLSAHRKAGVGSKLLSALEAEARRREVGGIILHAQVYALEFYKKHGYQPVGGIFEEAGMPHLEMRKKL